jgi:hemerythrin-like domain-containing protein
MKRHEALAPFSREHHGALILAQLLRKNAPAYNDLPVEPKDKAVYALQMYETLLKRHFRDEELMLEKVKRYHTDIGKLAVEIITEHHWLTDAFLSLANSADSIDRLDELGNALEKHIRKEERVLFPLIQEYCPAVILETLVL